MCSSRCCLVNAQRSSRLIFPDRRGLFDADEADTDTADQTETAKQKVTFERGKAKKGRPDNCVTSEGLRFDDDVPVKHIKLTPPEIEGL